MTPAPRMIPLRKIQPRRRVPLPGRKGGITEKDIERLTADHAEAFNLTPAEARAQVLRRLQMIKRK